VIVVKMRVPIIARLARGRDLADARARGESGVAMLIVIGVVVVLFLLTTMLVFLTTYMLRSGSAQEVRTKSMHVADAGLNAYLYELRRDATFYVTNPVLGPVVQEDGTWIIRATPPGGGLPLTLRAEGRVAGDPATHTVMATVRFPTFADYMFLSNVQINIGSGATIRGKVRSNLGIDNAGTITHQSYANGTITGTGSFGTSLSPPGVDAKFPGSTKVSFTDVTADTELIKTAAKVVNTYYDSLGTGYKGYRITVNGATYTVEKIKGLNTTTGTMTLEPVVGGTNVAIPEVGVVYFGATGLVSANNENVYVSGTYSKPITIVSERDIYVVDDYVPDSLSGANTAGLIAIGSVIVPIHYQSVPQDMYITAAMLAQTGAVYGVQTDGVIKNSITIMGSNSYFAYSYFVTSSGSTVIAGFRTRNYNYDQRLDIYAPPRFPVMHMDALKINTWIAD
jgi:hypothetical protein